jgi:hypothetical protein
MREDVNGPTAIIQSWAPALSGRSIFIASRLSLTQMIKTNFSQLFNAMNEVCSTSFGYVNKPTIRKRLKYRNKSQCNNRTTGPFTVGCDYYKHNTVRGTSVAKIILPASYKHSTRGLLETVFNFWG